MSRLGDRFRRGPRGERPPGSRPEAGPPAPTGPRFSLWALVAALGVAFALQYFTSLRGSPQRQAYSELRRALADDRVEEVLISSNLVRWRLKSDGKTTEQARTFEAVRIADEDLVRELDRRRVKTSGVIESSLFRDLLAWVLPLGLVVGVMIFLGRRAGQGPGGLLAVGQSKAKIYVEKEVGVTFADVAGVDEAKEELQEVVEFLKTPEKFRRLGGKIPKGVLVVGPPGTGKTLLARAVAGEASVPFFSISGSEFVELFVGVGAARVRDLFNQAKEKAPCIIFIDELDALGKARGMGPMAHEEREQTLNQLLVELDGFDARAGVILMAATNRPEILDPALLRAGRFDRHVLVDRPDRSGRLAILKLHARSILLADPADLEVIAGMTAGLVGADLANLVNEAALLGVRRGKETVGRGELVEAVERVIGGLEKKNRVLNPAEKQRVAYHEIGHALAAFALSGDAVQKISIIPRGIAALGYTLQLPTEDRFLMTAGELRNKIAVLLGGRAAEELIYGEVSTGAQDDLSRATEIARSMVKSYGMSHKLGHLSFDRGHRPLFLEAQGPERGDYSEETAREIDCEVRRLVDGQYVRVREVLMPQRRILEAAAVELLKRETLSGDELKAVVAQHPAEPAPSPLRSVR